MAARSTIQQPQIFHCGACNVSFSSRKSLVRHRRENQNHVATFNMPGIVLASTYKCDYCETTCRRLHDLRRHVDEIHRANSRKRRKLNPPDSVESESTGSGSMEALEDEGDLIDVHTNDTRPVRAITPKMAENQRSLISSNAPSSTPTVALPLELQTNSSLVHSSSVIVPPPSQNSLAILLPQRSPQVPLNHSIPIPPNHLHSIFQTSPPNPWLDPSLSPKLHASTQLGLEMERLSAQSIHMVNDRDWNWTANPAQTARSHFADSMTIDVGGGRMTLDENISFWQDFVEQFPRTRIEITAQNHAVDLSQGNATVEMFLLMGNGEHVVEGYKKSRWELEKERQRWMLVDASTVRHGGMV